MEIELGDKVKCKYTGFTGIAIAKTLFINGCVQISVAPKWDGKVALLEEMGIDSQSLEIVKRKTTTTKIQREENGGKSRKGFAQRGY